MGTHQKLALRALAGSASLLNLTSTSGHVQEGLPRGNFDAFPSPAPTLGARQSPPRYHLLDVQKCVLPTNKDVPIIRIPMYDGMPLDQPDPEMWHGLQMNAWLTRLFDGCPAVLTARCNDKGQDAGHYCGFTTALSVLLVGALNNNDTEHGSAVAFAGFPCTMTECQWNTNNGTRGFIRGSSERNTISQGASDNAILEYRRWYTMVAVKSMWRYHNALREMLDTAVITEGLRLQNLVDIMAPEEIKKAHETSAFDFLGLIRTIASFLPYGAEVNRVISGIDAAFDAAAGNTEKFWEEDLVDVAKGVADGVRRSHEHLGTFVDIVIATSPTYNKNFGSKIPKNETEASSLPKITLGTLGSTLADLFEDMGQALAAQTTAVITGDPSAPGGFLDLATTGLFSSWEPEENWSTIKDKAREYSLYIREKVLLSIFESMQMWLHAEEHPSEDICKRVAGYHPTFAGHKCMKSQWSDTQRDAYWPFIRKNWDWVGSLVNMADHTPQLNDENLDKVVPGLTLETLYQKSRDCFVSTQLGAIRANNGTTCHGVYNGAPRNFSPYTGWSSEIRSIANFTQSPRERLCHYNIPVLLTNLPEIRNGCQDTWYYRHEWSYDSSGYKTWLTASHADWNDFLLNEELDYRKRKNCPAFHGTQNAGPGLQYALALFYPQKSSDDYCALKKLPDDMWGPFTRWQHAAPPENYYQGYWN